MFDSLKKMFEKNAKTISLKAVEDGRTIPMDEVNDQTFAQELLGPGIAIVPSNGTVVSPINGTIATVMLQGPCAAANAASQEAYTRGMSERERIIFESNVTAPFQTALDVVINHRKGKKAPPRMPAEAPSRRMQ